LVGVESGADVAERQSDSDAKFLPKLISPTSV
jgi:hypothetical protein